MSPFLMKLSPKLSPGRKRKLTPIDPCRSRQKERCRDRYTKIPNRRFVRFFDISFCGFVVFWWFLVGKMEMGGRTLKTIGRTLKSGRTDIDGRTRKILHTGVRGCFFAITQLALFCFRFNHVTPKGGTSIRSSFGRFSVPFGSILVPIGTFFVFLDFKRCSRRHDGCGEPILCQTHQCGIGVPPLWST